jgi:hypothetical protein
MWYFPETNPNDLSGAWGFTHTLRMILRSRIPTLSDEEVNILVDIFLSLK